MSYPYARTFDEAYLYMELRPCVCGETEFDRESVSSVVDGVPVERYSGQCPTCGRRRQHPGGRLPQPAGPAAFRTGPRPLRAGRPDRGAGRPAAGDGRVRAAVRRRRAPGPMTPHAPAGTGGFHPANEVEEVLYRA